MVSLVKLVMDKTVSPAQPSPPVSVPPGPPSIPQQPPSGVSTDNHNGTSKILGRNANGIMVVTTPPSNEAELQLYRVLQRASLLAYYDTLLEMGGDDVQQLCDAGEEEFLEIMALVGMASKPLHVRRLQKALHEWVTNPAAFQIPIAPALCPTEPPFLPCSPRLLGLPPVHPSIPTIPSHSAALQRSAAPSPENSRPMYSPSPGMPESSCGSNSSAPNASPVHNITTNNSKVSSTPSSTTNTQTTNNSRSYSPLQTPTCPTSSNSSPSSVNCSPVQATPTLLESQIKRLAMAAEKLSRHLPQMEPKPQNAKKKMCKDLETVMMMPEDDPRRMDEIRKYAAIYGRFDCKRKPEKPLTLHEVSVNEAAAQMCRAVPALLTRRDELFPLARQVVRLSGFHYSKGHSQISSTCNTRSRSDSEGGSGKRPRVERDRVGAEGKEEDLRIRGGDVHSEGDVDLKYSLTTSGMWTRPDSEDGDSRYSFSNSCSPPLQDQDDGRGDMDGDGVGRERVRVVAASGDHIIAVANPALALLSRTLVPKREQQENVDNNN